MMGLRVGPVRSLDGDGGEVWTWNGVRHRAGGPAVVRPNGVSEWWWRGSRHRDDGPAIEYPGPIAGDFWVRGVCVDAWICAGFRIEVVAAAFAAGWRASSPPSSLAFRIAVAAYESSGKFPRSAAA